MNFARLIAAALLLTFAVGCVPPAPVVMPTLDVSLSPDKINKGESAMLSWKTTNSAKVSINGVFVALSGEQAVKPDVTTTYTFSAEGTTVIVQSQRVLTVSDKPPPITLTGLRVMVLLASTLDLTTLTPDQHAAYMGQREGLLRDYLRKNAARDSRGNPDCRFGSRDSDYSLDHPHWQAAKRAIDASGCEYPVIFATDGERTTIVTMPRTLAEIMAVVSPLKKSPPAESFVVAVPRQLRAIDPRQKRFTDGNGRSFDHFDDTNFAKLAGTLKAGDEFPSVEVAGEKRFLSLIPKPQRTVRSSRILSFADSGLKLIPESEWAAWIKRNNDAGSWPMNYCDFPCKDQNGTNYCWNNAPSHAAQMKARMQGLPGDEWSSASVGGPITGYKNNGGYGEIAVDYMVEKGSVPNEAWPNNSISSSKYQSTLPLRPHRKVVKFVEITTRQELFSAVAQGHPCSNDLGHWSHVIVTVAYADSSTTIIRNSWSEDWGTSLSFHNGTFGGFGTLSKSKSQDLGSGNTFAIVEVTNYAQAL